VTVAASASAEVTKNLHFAQMFKPNWQLSCRRIGGESLFGNGNARNVAFTWLEMKLSHSAHCGVLTHFSSNLNLS